jgi:hypothetical protein
VGKRVSVKCIYSWGEGEAAPWSAEGCGAAVIKRKRINFQAVVPADPVCGKGGRGVVG